MANIFLLNKLSKVYHNLKLGQVRLSKGSGYVIIFYSDWAIILIISGILASI